MKIYTRTGDKGQTSLFGGKRVSKASLRVETYGTVDELNSTIGVVHVEMSNVKYPMSNIQKELGRIQHDLFSIGSYLASPGIQNSELRVKSLGSGCIVLVKKAGKDGSSLHDAAEHSAFACHDHFLTRTYGIDFAVFFENNPAFVVKRDVFVLGIFIR